MHMIYYNKIDVSEGIYVSKVIASKECIICHYCHCLDKKYKFQSFNYDGYNDELMMFIGIGSVCILNIHGVNYCFIVFVISKSEVIYVLNMRI